VTHGIVADAGEFIRSLSDRLLSREPDYDLVFMREVALKQIKKESPFAQRDDYQSSDYWIVLADDDLRMVTQGMAQYVTYDPQFDPKDPKFDFEGLYRLGKPDLVKFAASLGAEAREASDLKQLRDALQAAKKGAQEGKPQVVVAHINPRRVPPPGQDGSGK
jgi:thiamine pyrophosphate-dependent acetolactate synthase large subunit-like protein